MIFAELLKENTTIKELIDYSVSYLEKHNIESAKLNVEQLLSFCSGMSRLDIIQKLHKTVGHNISNDFIIKFSDLLEERASHKPLQYILGKCYFYNIELFVNENALIPRPETEELVDIVVKEIRDLYTNKTINILDIGSGSGCISLALGKFIDNYKDLKENCTANILGIDISPKAVELSNINKEALQLTNVDFCNISFVDFVNKKFTGQNCDKKGSANCDKHCLTKFDFIVCNPPYISLADYNKLASELFFEPRIALTDGGDGLSFYRTLCENINILLASDGKLFLEFGLGQAFYICDLLQNIFFDTTIIKDFSNIERYIEAQRRAL